MITTSYGPNMVRNSHHRISNAFYYIEKIYIDQWVVLKDLSRHTVNITVVFAFNTTQFIELTVENDCMKNAIS